MAVPVICAMTTNRKSCVPPAVEVRSSPSKPFAMENVKTVHLSPKFPAPSARYVNVRWCETCLRLRLMQSSAGCKMGECVACSWMCGSHLCRTYRYEWDDKRSVASWWSKSAKDTTTQVKTGRNPVNLLDVNIQNVFISAARSPHPELHSKISLDGRLLGLAVVLLPPQNKKASIRWGVSGNEQQLRRWWGLR